MDTATIDTEYGKLQGEFQEVAGSVAALAAKMQAAAGSGDQQAQAWLADLKQIAQDIDEEQQQAHSLLLAIHGYITTAAQAAAASEEAHPPLYAPGQEPAEQAPAQHHGLLGGVLGGGLGGGGMMGGGLGGGMMAGGMMGGGLFGGYGGGGFARAMEMGAGMSLGANLIGSIFR
jgi:hypothetical protein